MSEARQYFIMHDGPIGEGKPWKAYMEVSPGLTIGTTGRTGESEGAMSEFLRDPLFEYFALWALIGGAVLLYWKWKRAR